MSSILSTLCYVRTATHTLMMHRNKRHDDIHAGKWNGLGGKFHPGETPEACVCREVREESGLTVEAPQLRGVLTFPGFDGDVDWHVFVFTAERFEGTLQECTEGDLQWIPNADLLALPLWEGDRIFMPWLEQKHFFSGRFVYRHGSLVEHSVVWHPATI